MFKIIVLVIVIFALYSCWNNQIVEKELVKNNINNKVNKDNYSFKISDDRSTLYLFSDWKKIKIDESLWSIQNTQILGDYLIYEWISTWGMLKKIYSIKDKKEIAKMFFWTLTENKQYIYSCEESWYWPWNIQVFDFEKNKLKNISSELNIWKKWIYIKKCRYSDYKIIFSLINNDNEISVYTYDLKNSTLEKEEVKN